VITTRPPSAPITGRKIQAEQQIIFNSNNGARFPIPVSVPVQKPKRSVPPADKKLLDISNRPPQPRAQSNNEGKKKPSTAKTPELRKLSLTEKKTRPNSTIKSSTSKTPKPPKPRKERKNDDHTLDPAKLVSKAGCVNNAKSVDRISTFEMLRQLADAPQISDSPDRPRTTYDERTDHKINTIVQQTLKDHKLSKLNKLKEEQEAREEREKRRRELQEMQNQVRQENLIRFKQENFTPKLAWGADQRKQISDPVLNKEIQEIRQRRRQERERAKSAGKARIGLDVLSQLKVEFKEPKRSSSTVPHEVQVQAQGTKKDKKTDPTVLQYMKLQKLQRKMKQEAEAIEHKSEEAKRLSQLKQLEIRCKSKLSKLSKTKKQKKQPKSKAKLKRKLAKVPEERWVEDSYLSDPEDHEVMGIMHQINESIPDPYNREGRESRVFGHFAPTYLYDEVGNATHLVNKIVEKRIHEDISLPPQSVTMPILDAKECRSLYNLHIPSQNSSVPLSNDEQKSYDHYDVEDDFDNPYNSDISRKKQEIRKKLAELRNRMDRFKESVNEERNSITERGLETSERAKPVPDLENVKKGVSIMNNFARWKWIEDVFESILYLDVLGRPSEEYEDFLDEDEEVQLILNGRNFWHIPQSQDIENLGDLEEDEQEIEDHEISQSSNEPEQDSLEHVPVQDISEELEDKEVDFSVEKEPHFEAIVPGQRLSTDEIEVRLNQELRNIEAKQQRVENLLLLQQQLQEVHQQALEQLREKDLKDMKKLSQHTGRDNQLIDIFKTILNRRYAELSQMFQENIEAVRQVLEQQGSESLTSTLEHRSEIHKKLDEDMRSMIERYQKSFLDSQEEEVDRLFAGELGTRVCAEIEEKVEKEMKREIPKPVTKKTLSMEFKDVSPIEDEKSEDWNEVQPISQRISRVTSEDNFKHYDDGGYMVFDSSESERAHQIRNYEEVRKKFEDNARMESAQSEQSLSRIHHASHSGEFEEDIDIDKYLLEISSREHTGRTNKFYTGEFDTILKTESLPKVFNTIVINATEYKELYKPILPPEIFIEESFEESYSESDLDSYHKQGEISYYDSSHDSDQYSLKSDQPSQHDSYNQSGHLTDLSGSFGTQGRGLIHPIVIPTLNLSNKFTPHESPDSYDHQTISSNQSEDPNIAPTSSPRSQISIDDIKFYDNSSEGSPFTIPDSESSSLVTSQITVKSPNSPPNIFSTEVISPISKEEQSIRMPELSMFEISPEKGRKKVLIRESPDSTPREKAILIDVGQSPNSSSISHQIKDDSLLLDTLQAESESADFEDIIPERPPAPLSTIEEFERSKGSSSSIGEDIGASEESDIEWVEELRSPRVIDANFMNEVAEELLKRLLNEDLVPVPSRNLPDLPPLNLQELPPRPVEGLTTTTEPRINTDQVAVKKYVEEIFNACLQRKTEFMQNIQKPLFSNPPEILARMQENEIGTPNLHDFQIPQAVLGVDLYLQLERLREESSHRDELSPGTLQLVSEAEHIHNKMIFDAVNEALQRYRPYGTKGLPMPWSAGSREVSSKALNVDRAVKEVIQEVEKWSLVQAGKVPTGDMMLSSGMLDEEHLRQIREERLANMLADEVIERDAEWVDYEFEETQVKLDLADMVLEHLITETIAVLDSF
jgi:hypothetical protein